jgi:hypothetical protein
MIRNRKISTTDRIIKKTQTKTRQPSNSRNGTGLTTKRSKKSKNVAKVANGSSQNKEIVHDLLPHGVCVLQSAVAHSDQTSEPLKVYTHLFFVNMTS